MSNTQFHTEEAVQAAINALYTEEYFEDIVNTNKDFLTGKASEASQTLDAVEQHLKVLLPIIDRNANEVLAAHGFVGNTAIFSVFAYANDQEPEKTATVTVSIRVKVDEGSYLKVKDSFVYGESFLENLITFVHNYELKLLDAIVTRDNTNVLNNVMAIVTETEEGAQVAFPISFAPAEVPLVSLRPDGVTFGVDAFKARHVVPTSGFADLLEVYNREQAEQAEQAELEKLAATVEEALEEVEVEEELEGEVAEEVAASEEIDVVEEVEEEEETLEDLVARFVPKEEEEEEVQPSVLELMTQEERDALVQKEYKDTVTAQKAEAFLAGLLDTWLSSANPLEFINGYNAAFFDVVAGNITRTRCEKVMPVLKESFRLSEKALRVRKQGAAIIVRTDETGSYAHIMKKHNGEIVEEYPEFNTVTFK